MPLAVHTYIGISVEDAANLQEISMSPPVIRLSRTFFLLQATHAVGARNGGGLKSFIFALTVSFISRKVTIQGRSSSPQKPGITEPPAILFGKLHGREMTEIVKEIVK
jgi:hypothetical protein